MIIRAPQSPPIIVTSQPVVFLAGSIEMGKAVSWQTRLEEALDDKAILLNPRRLDWDSSWVQDPDVDGPFKEQVEWELACLELANKIVMYFDPNTQSPISLLELGLYARSGKLTVCCPPGYFRYGNVKITCKRYGVPMVDTIEELIASVCPSR